MSDKWYKKSSELLREIEETSLPKDLCSLWYIGQMGMILKWKGIVLCIDPVLGAMPGENGEDRRNYPVPFLPEELRADYVFCTHDHGDHMHQETLVKLAERNPQMKIVLPLPLVEKALSFGISKDQLFCLCQDQEVTLEEGIQVNPAATAHEAYQFDQEGHSLTLGYEIRLGDHRFFHSGDTIVTRELIDKLQKSHGIDAAMIPINGRDLERSERDIVGNMNSREACWFASEIGADLTIPLHYAMIGGNEENPLVFADYMERYYPEKKYHIFRLGERYIL